MMLRAVWWYLALFVGMAPYSVLGGEFNWLWNVGGAEGIDLSQYPAILEGKVALFTTYLGRWPLIQSDGTWCNGGLPQLGNLSLHMAKVKSDIAARLNTTYSGLVVIDFESWNPVWNRTGTLYQENSIKLVEVQHPSLPPEQQEKIAMEAWTTSSRNFFLGTLSAVREALPNAQGIGFYGFPTRFFYNGYCDPNWGPFQKELNDELKWLWNASSALFPSVYQFYDSPNTWPEDTNYTTCSIGEGIRVAESFGHGASTVYPYGWPRLHTSQTPLLSPNLSTIEFLIPHQTFPQLQAMIIWGAEGQNATNIHNLQQWLATNKNIWSQQSLSNTNSPQRNHHHNNNNNLWNNWTPGCSGEVMKREGGMEFPPQFHLCSL